MTNSPNKPNFPRYIYDKFHFPQLLNFILIYTLAPNLTLWAANQTQPDHQNKMEKTAVLLKPDETTDLIGSKKNLLERFGIDIDVIGGVMVGIFKTKVKLRANISIEKQDSGVNDVSILLEIIPSPNNFSSEQISKIVEQVEQLGILSQNGVINFMFKPSSDDTPKFIFHLFVN